MCGGLVVVTATADAGEKYSVRNFVRPGHCIAANPNRRLCK